MPPASNVAVLVVDLRPVGANVQVKEVSTLCPISDLCAGHGPLAELFADEGLCISLLRAFVDNALCSPSSYIGHSAQTLTFRPRSDPIMRGVDYAVDG